MKIKILYEDSNILAVDKPSGIAVHVDGKSKDPSNSLRAGKTIADWFVKKYPRAKNVGEPIFVDGREIKKPGVVHRLDKETSGVLLLAKNRKAYEFLKNQFKERKVKKTYHAVVSGFVKNDRGIINKPIGRSPKDFRRHLSGRGVRGELRDAITEYRVLKRFQALCAQNFSSCALPRVRGGTLGDKNFAHTHPFTYLEIHPKTGRTHQIRVHMKYLNHPVVCDTLYAPQNPCPKNFKRLALHAKAIEFKDLKGKVIKIESPLPTEFERLMKM